MRNDDQSFLFLGTLSIPRDPPSSYRINGTHYIIVIQKLTKSSSIQVLSTQRITM